MPEWLDSIRIRPRAVEATRRSNRTLFTNISKALGKGRSEHQIASIYDLCQLPNSKHRVGLAKKELSLNHMLAEHLILGAQVRRECRISYEAAQ